MDRGTKPKLWARATRGVSAISPFLFAGRALAAANGLKVPLNNTKLRFSELLLDQNKNQNIGAGY